MFTPEGEPGGVWGLLGWRGRFGGPDVCAEDKGVLIALEQTGVQDHLPLVSRGASLVQGLTGILVGFE